jgi:hypothetical protein
MTCTCCRDAEKAEVPSGATSTAFAGATTATGATVGEVCELCDGGRCCSLQLRSKHHADERARIVAMLEAWAETEAVTRDRARQRKVGSGWPKDAWRHEMRREAFADAAQRIKGAASD